MHEQGHSSHLPFIHVCCASGDYAENMKNAFVLVKSHGCLCSCDCWRCWNKGILHHYKISCFSTSLLPLVFQWSYAKWVKTCVLMCLRAFILETLRCFGTLGESWTCVGLDVTMVNSAISTRKTGPVKLFGLLCLCGCLPIFLGCSAISFPFLTSGSDFERRVTRHWWRGTVRNNESENIFMHGLNTLMRVAGTGSCNVWRQMQSMEMTCHPSQRQKSASTPASGSSHFHH